MQRGTKNMEKDKFNLGPITQGMREAPFYCKGMTSEEWEEEHQYMIEHFDEWLAGTYLPLWKQKLKNND